MHNKELTYSHEEAVLKGYIAFDSQYGEKLPVVLIIHDWSGRNDLVCQRADWVASLGYLGFAIDMYGQARVGKTVEEKQHLMAPFLKDRTFLLNRVRAALNALSQLDSVDKQRVVVMGFCFGGLCALDLARSGEKLAGAISVHGLLNKPENYIIKPLSTSILALHGYEDPMVPPQMMQDFCQEMTESAADWQVHLYGQTKHAFTNPEAHDKQLGTIYNASAERRAFQTIAQFLQERFSKA